MSGEAFLNCPKCGKLTEEYAATCFYCGNTLPYQKAIQESFKKFPIPERKKPYDLH